MIATATKCPTCTGQGEVTFEEAYELGGGVTTTTCEDCAGTGEQAPVTRDERARQAVERAAYVRQRVIDHLAKNRCYLRACPPWCPSPR